MALHSQLFVTESERSDDEKAVHGRAEVVMDLPGDPDAHLSEAERASIVRP
jgi:hypothetical protein